MLHPSKIMAKDCSTMQKSEQAALSDGSSVRWKNVEDKDRFHLREINRIYLKLNIGFGTHRLQAVGTGMKAK
jgi:hypothetical protein